jgi:hypothetical protein
VKWMRLSAIVALSLITTSTSAAELQPRTVAAFDKYVSIAEPRIDIDGYLWLDSLPAPQRQSRLAEVKRGMLAIQRLELRDGEREIDVPGGLIHHWVGAVFIPGVSVDAAVALLQDYDRHAMIYAPVVARSRVLARDGDEFKVFLRFVMKKVITVVVNSEHRALFSRPGSDRARSRIASTKIAEVIDPNTPREREAPVGRDSGYLWRLNTYWRFLQRDGGVYIECESISLSRGIPRGLGWIVGPFVTSVPRESLAFTLETTRRVLADRQ